MLKIWKYLLCSIVCSSLSFGDILTWGGYTKMEISKNQVEEITKQYVDTTYSKKVKEYNQHLQKIKESKIKSVSNNTFVDDNLMWQDTKANETLLLNQLESKRYCKELVFAKRKDWRVPTYKELLMLVDYTKANPASIDKIKNIVPQDYWSDTQVKQTQEAEKKSFWFVNFSLGKSDIANEMEKKHIRCVRELSSKKDNY